MGSRGPVPKRSAERRRQNKDGTAVTVKATGHVSVPTLPKTAHPIARRWYLALKQSGQSEYFEPSDWAAALLVVDHITRLLTAANLAAKERDYENIAIRAGHFAGLWTAMESLLTTEGARRRMRIEIERQPADADEQPEGITAIESFRQRMGAQG